MFAANTELQSFARGPAPLYREFDQLPDAVNIEADERITRKNAFVDVGCEESSGIVATDPQGGLGEVIGPEAKKFADFGDLARHECSAG